MIWTCSSTTWTQDQSHQRQCSTGFFKEPSMLHLITSTSDWRESSTPRRVHLYTAAAIAAISADAGTCS
ncbi:hypothetical protein OYC64_013980 [Pagothenia borchgrevinki]|uniref:Uncharacterized protein n=1 Tax=Pagothenia borchgrevinki TaxID=8213 RepID=A0ABD2FVJ7_PAGBO